jgi:hypothetical protein
MGQNKSHGLGQTNQAKGELEQEFFSLDFSVHKSRRYHEKLAAFYGSWRDRMRVVTAIAGSGAFFIVVSGWQHTAVAITAFVALWAILDIIVMPDKKHDRHNELCKRFTSLAAKIQRSLLTKEALKELIAERLLIEENEPPCKRLVDIESRNDEWRSRGYSPDELAPLSGWQRVFGYFVTFGLPRLERWKAERQRRSSDISSSASAQRAQPDI